MTDKAQELLTIQNVERAFAENERIRGSLGHLSDSRLVFIGERPDEKDCWFVAFRNSEGDDTRLMLSKEAMAMLVQLYKRHPKGDDVYPLRIKTAWQIVVKETDNPSNNSSTKEDI